jgi:hypothetical protein
MVLEKGRFSPQQGQVVVPEIVFVSTCLRPDPVIQHLTSPRAPLEDAGPSISVH